MLHHLLHEKIDCNTSSATIALMATSSVHCDDPPACFDQICGFFIDMEPFPPQQFCFCNVYDDRTKGVRGNIAKMWRYPATAAAVTLMLISPATSDIKMVRAHQIFEDLQILHLSHIIFSMKFLFL
jgi:hypothetical protein